MQRFMSSYMSDLDLIARFIMLLLPHTGPYTLTMDRTNWQFGTTDTNDLVLGITYEGVAFPVLFRLLPKCGNSNTAERIEIINRFIKLFGKDSIESLTADREFVGEAWLNYLNSETIPYHIRIRENFGVKDTRTGKLSKAFRMFNHLRLQQSLVLHRIYYLNNQLCYLSAARLKNQDGKPELQIPASCNKPDKSLETYKKRWQTETCFRAMKTSVFNIEDTHLTHLDRIERLFAVMILAFTREYLAGIYKHKMRKPVRMLKHGRKAKSLFKYGVEEIAKTLLNYWNKAKFDIFQFLKCT
ncbi:MAG: IS4 family transposase [Bacteroidales bacterium]|nr:IS4 family transposase [Bacteroidales bacterium]